MSEISKSLYLARKAIGNGDLEGAKAHYEAAFKENSKNLEAEWFYLLASVTDAVTKETADQYARLSEIFYPTLRYIATFDENEDKWMLARTVVKTFPPLYDVLHQYVIKELAKNNAAFTMEDAMKYELATKVEKKQLAEDILRIFGDSKPYCDWTTDIWKEMIAERFQLSAYRNFQDKGKELWFDQLAKRIQKYDPSYELPQFKQAGCVSSGDAAHISPGQ